MVFSSKSLAYNIYTYFHNIHIYEYIHSHKSITSETGFILTMRFYGFVAKPHEIKYILDSVYICGFIRISSSTFPIDIQYSFKKKKLFGRLHWLNI